MRFASFLFTISPPGDASQRRSPRGDASPHYRSPRGDASPIAAHVATPAPIIAAHMATPANVAARVAHIDDASSFRYRRALDRPELSFYVDKVARKRWLPTIGIDQPKSIALRYSSCRARGRQGAGGSGPAAEPRKLRREASGAVDQHGFNSRFRGRESAHLARHDAKRRTNYGANSNKQKKSLFKTLLHYAKP
jgi:hypothetical protein